MSRFTLPRDLYYGADSLAELKNLKGKKAILVLGGGSMKKFGFVDKALSYLKEAGIETILFEYGKRIRGNKAHSRMTNQY